MMRGCWLRLPDLLSGLSPSWDKLMMSLWMYLKRCLSLSCGHIRNILLCAIKTVSLHHALLLLPTSKHLIRARRLLRVMNVFYVRGYQMLASFGMKTERQIYPRASQGWRRLLFTPNSALSVIKLIALKSSWLTLPISSPVSVLKICLKMPQMRWHQKRLLCVRQIS